MGGKSKRFLKEEVLPTIFSFSPEPARERRVSSISRAEKPACIEEAISSHEACSSHVYKENIQELELTSEKCIGAEPVITVDKAVGKHTTTKSVRTQYNPLYVLNTLKTTETFKNDLNVKWPTSKRRKKAVLNRALPLTMKETNLTILRRQVKVIIHLTRANNQMKV